MSDVDFCLYFWRMPHLFYYNDGSCDNVQRKQENKKIQDAVRISMADIITLPRDAHSCNLYSRNL